ncbi:hypothetical protein PV646_41245 [Streptomyces sp. ID05-26A]|nr:hypothetical protein [Streptomyces sp. ID05-26A]
MVSPGSALLAPIVRFSVKDVLEHARALPQPQAGLSEVSGAVWPDVSAGGCAGQNDPAERDLPGLTVDLLRGGEIVVKVMTGDDGLFTASGLASGQYSVRLPADDFALPFEVCPDRACADHAGSHLFVKLDHDRIRDHVHRLGATEWQVFKRDIVPLLDPVLLTVFMTLLINLLKIFELIASGSVQKEANVLAVGAQHRGAWLVVSAAVVAASMAWQRGWTWRSGRSSRSRRIWF